MSTAFFALAPSGQFLRRLSGLEPLRGGVPVQLTHALLAVTVVTAVAVLVAHRYQRHQPVGDALAVPVDPEVLIGSPTVHKGDGRPITVELRDLARVGSIQPLSVGLTRPMVEVHDLLTTAVRRQYWVVRIGVALEGDL